MRNLFTGSHVRALLSRWAHDTEVLFTISTNGLILMLSIVPAILAARMLGPIGRGELAAALVWSALFSAVVQFGVPQGLTYLAASRKAGAEQLLSIAALMVLAQTVLLVVTAWALLPLLARLRPDLVDSLQRGPVLVPLLLAGTYVSAILQGLSRFALWNMSRTIIAAAYPAWLIRVAAAGTRAVPRILAMIITVTALSVGAVVVLVTREIGRPGRVHPDDQGTVEIRNQSPLGQPHVACQHKA